MTVTVDVVGGATGGITDQKAAFRGIPDISLAVGSLEMLLRHLA